MFYKINRAKFFESSVKEKIGKILMALGALSLLFPMSLYTGVALMAETEPAVNVVILLLSGCLAGPLTIFSVILSFFKKISKIGFIGSICFSLPFLAMGIWMAIPSSLGPFWQLSFVEIIGIITVFLLFSISSIFIIIGTILRVTQKSEIII